MSNIDIIKKYRNLGKGEVIQHGNPCGAEE
jgi:hypothetical protein